MSCSIYNISYFSIYTQNGDLSIVYLISIESLTDKQNRKIGNYKYRA